MQGKARAAMKNVALFAGTRPSPVPGDGGPYKYAGKQFEYFENPTSAFIFENAQYAANYYKAEVQGIMPGTFETKREAYIRSSDVVEQTTGSKMPNDYQVIYFQDTRIRGLYTGAKVKYGGNTWLAISPFNVSDPMSSAVVRRCNAVWKHLDYYGNVLAEPFVFQDGRAQSTANEYLDYSVIPNWYQKCVIQLNDETKELKYNKRMILGSTAVEVRGISDFITDFTGEGNGEEAEPTHAMFFDVQFQQPLEMDDMENGVAGGKAFTWEILPVFSAEMGVNATQTITASSRRNGETVDEEQHEVTYLFSSSDSSVLTVDADGEVTGVGEGTATVTITLMQNPKYQAQAEITVAAATPNAQFTFTPELPMKLKQMQRYTGTVSVIQGGTEITTAITVSEHGATEAASVAFNGAGNTLTIESYEPSDVPLSLVFKAEEYSLVYTHNIQLEGY